DDGLPNQPQNGFPGNYLAMPALQHAFDHFWANDPGPGGVGLQDRYAAAWRHVAERFAGNRYVLGYDLLNEPWPGSTWQECSTSDDLVMSNADKRSAATGDALLMSEWGATDDVPSLLGPLELADKHMMSWQEWHYCGCDDPTTTGSGDKQAIVLDPSKPPSGDNLKTTTLDVLSRPYPRLISGTPDSWAFDPDTRQFTFGYNPSQ